MLPLFQIANKALGKLSISAEQLPIASHEYQLPLAPLDIIYDDFTLQ